LQDAAWRGAVAPDGSAIVFIRARFPIREVWLMGAGGEHPERVVTGALDDTFWQVGWSPDSHRIVYGRASGGGSELQSFIEARDRDSQHVTVLASGRRLFQDFRGALPFFWIAGGRFVYAMREMPPNEGSSNLCVTRIDARAPPASASRPQRLTQLGNYNVRDVRATLGGSRLTFLRERSQLDVYVASFDGASPAIGVPRRVTLDDRDDYPGAWTPDASQIVFASRRAGSW